MARRLSEGSLPFVRYSTPHREALQNRVAMVRPMPSGFRARFRPRAEGRRGCFRALFHLWVGWVRLFVRPFVRYLTDSGQPG